MTAVRSAAIFLLSAILELAGTYAVWRWLRLSGPPLLAFAGAGALFVYAVVQTYQPVARYGRVYAAYAGVFLVGAMLWGWVVDGRRPDFHDWLGGAIVLIGVLVILVGRRVLG